MQTYLERTVLAVQGCAVAMVLCGCGSSSTTTSTVTTTITNPDGSTTTATTPGGSTSGGSTSGGSTSGGSTSGGSTSYAVGGTVSGLATDESVALLDNGGDAVAVSSDGAFTFPTRLAGGSAYAVTVKSHTPGIACSVTNGSGMLAASDVTAVAVSCATGKETILYSFAGRASGQTPLAGLVMDGGGNLYGTTQKGGTSGQGVVFKLSASGTETVLHSFGGTAADGQGPQAPLIIDSAGNLYGTAQQGGTHGQGVVFKLSAGGTETILYSFGATAADGLDPAGGLVMDSAGNLYGTTEIGGAFGAGTVFELNAAGAETVLHTFLALGMGTDGQNPVGTLVKDSAGNLYGTTNSGGAGTAGTVFKLTTGGTETVLYSFSNMPTDGHTPYAGVIVDSAGTLYGTTVAGGPNGGGRGGGVVFSLTAAGKETVLYSFGGSASDGLHPYASLVRDSAGNLFGTTQSGGASGPGGPNHGGTVFKLSAGGTQTILYSFGAAGASDGNAPQANLITDAAGNLYGTTSAGGAHGDGTVFKID
jgi:uncharacterized repeat protein (TIGR03803 family)